MCLFPAQQVNAHPPPNNAHPRAHPRAHNAHPLPDNAHLPTHNAPQPAFDEQEGEQDVEPLAPVVPVPDKGIYQNLVHASTLVKVDKLEGYIKERDTITDGFVPEYNVSHCS